jgi:hypothetical protein
MDNSTSGGLDWLSYSDPGSSGSSESGGGLNWNNLLSSALTGAGTAYAASRRPQPAPTNLSKILPIALIGVVVIVVASVFLKRG